MLKMPDDAIAQLQTARLENRIIKNIQRENFAVFNVISYLPAHRTLRRKHAREFVCGGDCRDEGLASGAFSLLVGGRLPAIAPFGRSNHVGRRAQIELQDTGIEKVFAVIKAARTFDGVFKIAIPSARRGEFVGVVREVQPPFYF